MALRRRPECAPIVWGRLISSSGPCGQLVVSYFIVHGKNKSASENGKSSSFFLHCGASVLAFLASCTAAAASVGSLQEDVEVLPKGATKILPRCQGKAGIPVRIQTNPSLSRALPTPPASRSGRADGSVCELGLQHTGPGSTCTLLNQHMHPCVAA